MSALAICFVILYAYNAECDDILEKDNAALISKCSQHPEVQNDACVRVSYNTYYGCMYSYDVECLIMRQCVRLFDTRTDDCIDSVGYSSLQQACTLIKNWDCVRAAARNNSYFGPPKIE